MHVSFYKVTEWSAPVKESHQIVWKQGMGYGIWQTNLERKPQEFWVTGWSWRKPSKQGPESRGPWTKAFRGEKNGNQHLKSSVTKQILWNKVSMTFIGILTGYVEYEPLCQCRRHERHGFDPCIQKITWRRAWQPAPVFLPGEFHAQRSQVGCSSQRVGHDWRDLAGT